jgi:hypothetical protein
MNPQPERCDPGRALRRRPRRSSRKKGPLAVSEQDLFGLRDHVMAPALATAHGLGPKFRPYVLTPTLPEEVENRPEALRATMRELLVEIARAGGRASGGVDVSPRGLEHGHLLATVLNVEDLKDCYRRRCGGVLRVGTKNSGRPLTGWDHFVDGKKSDEYVMRQALQTLAYCFENKLDRGGPPSDLGRDAITTATLDVGIGALAPRRRPPRSRGTHEHRDPTHNARTTIRIGIKHAGLALAAVMTRARDELDAPELRRIALELIRLGELADALARNPVPKPARGTLSLVK